MHKAGANAPAFVFNMLYLYIKLHKMKKATCTLVSFFVLTALILFSFLPFRTFAQSWSELGTGSNALKANAPISAIAGDNAGNIYACGAFTNGTTFPNGYWYVAKWNGTSWNELGTGG